ncbi:MAG: 50S ribosomal protein L4 [Candidatus Omnitrophica bacterium CG11_big_fil_rev_8_21_14_0_20_42_13]|uniref:Large ribosomal subunit protein uL4 n=1 Tax=Candidatus Ghiorseimicrobium undicola TaxID=1974746 RepID=A0A2H0LVC9_9BACT|nr:MAG: 50S ribosomal protein L4 [Candidatus Omnitrophica bacterium CG11_big_fil_rev_8_21_14_0_20_42_13]
MTDIKSNKKNNLATKDPQDFKLSVYGSDGRKLEDLVLDKHIFDGGVNKDILHQAVICYQANLRTGTASTKTRGEVSGGGKKPWRQKGTGRARAGSSRSPLFKHGGVTFGPRPRDFSYTIPQKIRISALKSSINSRLNNQDVILLDSLAKLEKTKDAIKLLSHLPGIISGTRLSSATLGVFDNSAGVRRSMGNIANLNIIRPEDVTAYDVLCHKKLLMTKEALKKITSRIKNSL